MELVALSFSVALLLTARVCCTSGQYCYGEQCSDLEATEEPDQDEDTALRPQSAAETGISMVSLFTGAVGSFFRPVFHYLYTTAARTVDFATKVAYKVWEVLIDEVHEAIKDYIPMIPASEYQYGGWHVLNQQLVSTIIVSSQEPLRGNVPLACIAYNYSA